MIATLDAILGTPSSARPGHTDADRRGDSFTIRRDGAWVELLRPASSANAGELLSLGRPAFWKAVANGRETWWRFDVLTGPAARPLAEQLEMSSCEFVGAQIEWARRTAGGPMGACRAAGAATPPEREGVAAPKSAFRFSGRSEPRP